MNRNWMYSNLGYAIFLQGNMTAYKIPTYFLLVNKFKFYCFVMNI